ncbi:hypothetical protein MJO28_011676 [Puccinia striiformis f. sp. tritici]|uniref:Uncharacterized protein n=1 Tax=Puccinia striiformis f. sp. tritici TaxID=168172 RepID=A0ACC0E4R6_9BASI|nr:hypothetical protein MJO28_011676 [Puccinia striiformis f. sp. tritici]
MVTDGIHNQLNQPEQAHDHPEQQQWLGYGGAMAEHHADLDGLLSPTRSSTAQPTDRQPSADESLAYLADDCSGFLSDYVFDNSLTAAPGLAFDSTLRPDPISSHPSHLTPSPQPLSAPSTAAGRRATVASVPSRLPFCASGLIPFQSGSEAPQTLDAAYNLLAGWGNPYSTFQLLSHPIQEQPIGSPYTDVEFAVENEPLASQYIHPDGSHAFSTDEVLRTTTHGGPEGLEAEIPFFTPYHRQSFPQWEPPAPNRHLSLIPSNHQAGLDFPSSPSFLAPSTHGLAHSHSHSIQQSPLATHFIPDRQPTEFSSEGNSEPSHLPHDPCHSYEQLFFNQTWEPTGEASSGPLFLDSGIPPVASNSSFAAAYHSDPRRVSDPLPVAPIAQRPWEPQQRFSIASIPCHVSVEDSVDESPYSHYLRPSYDLPASCAGSSRHSDSFSTTASHLNSSELPTPSTAIFGHEIYDQSAQLALQHLENQVASLGNLDFAANGSLAPIDSPNQKSPSYRSKSSSSHSAHEGTPSATGGGVNSVSASDSENIRADLPAFAKRGRAATLSGTLVPSSLPLESFTSSNRAQFTSEYMNVFRQGSQLPFGLPPHPHGPMSPFAPSAVFPSRIDLSHLSPGPSPFTESFHPSSSEFSHLPQLSCRESQFQQQDRLRRSTIMSQSPWSEVHAGPMALLPSPSSSFRGYQQRADCDLSSSPEKTSEVSSRAGSSRKRKSMKKDSQLSQTSVLEEHEQESPGIDRGGSDDVSSDRTGGCSQENSMVSVHKLLRFGGIGQGKSAHPPGLNGAVRPSNLDLAGVLDEAGEIMIPWRQDLRCDEDLYTPMWCRGQNDKKEGFCDMCEGGSWFRLKNSAYWYHKQYFHGVSSTTGHYFYPPREIKRGFSTANRQQILGMCHECDEWVGFSSIIGQGTVKKNQAHPQLRSEAAEEAADSRPDWLDGEEPGTSKVPTLWYKHAHKCHRHQTCKGAKGRKKAKRA